MTEGRVSVDVDNALERGVGFRLLGPVEVVRCGQRLDLGRRRERLLLGLLLLEPGRVVPVPRLIELLWDADAPPSARASLRTHVARLRATLADCDITLAGRTDGYLADVDADRVDLHLFVESVGTARQLNHPDERSAALRDALGLWRGPLLADVADDRLRQRLGAGLDEVRMSAIELLADADLESGRPEQVIADLSGVVEAHPTWERSIGLLMTALYRCGRGADALALYDRTRRLLAEELGVDPGPGLCRVYEQVLHSDPALDALATAPITAAGHGVVPRQLPRDVANFVGRDGDLALLDEISAGEGGVPAIILTTISGTAGVGKTALAVRWAHHAADRFPDGQLFVDLRGFDIGPPLRPIDALVQLLLALGVEPDRIPAGQDEAAGLYRSLLADRRTLVVLDNAATAESVRPLLPGGSGCLVVITSRNRLSGLVAHDGARPIALDALNHAESVALLTQVIGARRVEAEPEAADALATACGHLPLALRIAAATLVDQPRLRIADYLARFGQTGRLNALRIEDDERSAVGAAFDQSYATLSAATRRVFRLLSLFPAGWTAEAAAAAADLDLDATTRILARLAEAHLVAEPSPGRFDLHDLLRVYAHERLLAEESAAARDSAIERIYLWYLGHVDASARLLWPTVVRVHPPMGQPQPDFADRDAALRWHKDERSSLLALVGWPPEAATARLAVILADAMRGYYVIRRNPVDWLTVGTAAVTAAEFDGDTRLRAAAHLNLCAATGNVGARLDAIAQSEHAVELARAAGWLEGELAGLNLLGTSCDNAGRYERAEEVLTEALRINRAAGRHTGAATNLTNLGRLHLKLGQLETAAARMNELLDVVRERDLPYPAAFALCNLGDTYRLLGRWDDALRLLAEAVEAGRTVGNISGEATALANVAYTYVDMGRLAEAAEAAEAAMAVIAEVGESYTEAVAMGARAKVHYRTGELTSAVTLLDRIVAVDAQIESLYPAVNARITLGLIAKDHGEYVRALDQVSEARRLAREASLPLVEADAMIALASIHEPMGDPQTARELAERALEVHTRSGHRLGQARALAVLGRHAEADEIFTELGIPEIHRKRT